MRRILASILAAALLATSVQTVVFAEDTVPTDGNNITAADTVGDGQQTEGNGESTDSQEPEESQKPENPTGGGTSEDLGEETTQPDTDGDQVPDDSQETGIPENPGDDKLPDEDKPNEDEEQKPDEPPADSEDKKPGDGDGKPAEGEGENKTQDGEKPAEGEELPENVNKVPEQDNSLSKDNIITDSEEPVAEYFEEVRAVPSSFIREAGYSELKSFVPYGLRAAAGIDNFYGKQLNSFGRVIYDELYKEVSNPQTLGVKFEHDPVEYSFKVELTTEQAADESQKNAAIQKQFENIRHDQFQAVYDCMNLDHSDKFFWVNVQGSGFYTSFIEFTLDSWNPTTQVANGKVSFNIYTGYNLINLAIDPYYGSTVEDAQSVMDKLDKAVKAFPALGRSRYDQVKTIHDELANQVTYNHENMNAVEAHDPTGALFEPYLAVCEGYAKAFKAVCDEHNIPCVLGWGNSHGEGHMWNYVQMEDGKWYPVDVTWDDQEENGTFSDYLLTGLKEVAKNFGTQTFEEDHTVEYKYMSDLIYEYPSPISETKYDPNDVKPVLSGTAKIVGTIWDEERGLIGDTVIKTETELDTSEGANLIWSWYKDGSVIEGATTDSYTVKESDLGSKIYAKITAENRDGEVITNTVTVSKQYKFTVTGENATVSAEGTGITFTDGTVTGWMGDTVKLTASPSEGYKFTGWFNGETSVNQSAEYSFVLNDTNVPANYSLTAKSAETYKLTVDGSGTMTAKVGYTEAPKAIFTLTNTGTGSLNLTASLSDVSNFTVAPASVTLEAGKTGTVTVTAKTGLAVGNHPVTLTFHDVNLEEDVTQNIILNVVDKSLVTFSGVPENSTSVYNAQSQKVSLDGISAQADDGTTFAAKDFTVTYTQDEPAALKDYVVEDVAVIEDMRDAGKYVVTVRLDTPSYTGETSFTHTITPAPLTLTAKAENREYDGTTSVKVITTFGGVLDSDDVKVDPASIPTTGTMADKHGGTDKKVTVDLSKAVLTGKDAANYTLEGVSSETTVTIQKKPIEFHIYAESKEYDGNTKAKFRAEFIGLIEGDRIPTVEGEPTFNQADVGKNISITVTNIKTRWDVHFRDNYDYGNRIYRHGADITPKPVTLTFGESEFTYDSSPKTMTAVYTDVNGQQQQASLTYTDADGKMVTPMNAGDYIATAAISDTNYELTGEKTAKLQIQKGNVSVTAPTITIAAGNTAPVTDKISVTNASGAEVRGKFTLLGELAEQISSIDISPDGKITVSLKSEAYVDEYELQYKYESDDGNYWPVDVVVTIKVAKASIKDTLQGNPATVKFGEDLPEMTVVSEYDYGNGNKKTKTIKVTADMVEGFNKNNPGIQTVTIVMDSDSPDYKRNLTFNIEVVDYIKSVAVTAPEKTSYTLNKDKVLDLTSGKATITMASGTTKEVSLNAPEITCIGFNPGIIGNQPISVTYKDQHGEMTAENAFIVAVASEPVPVDQPNTDANKPSVSLGKDDQGNETTLVKTDDNGNKEPVEPSDVSLIVEPVKEQEKVEEIVKNDIPDTMEKMPVEIRLEDTTGDEVQPKGSITIRIPFPAGTDSSFTFTLFHIMGEKSQRVTTLNIGRNGITFTVTSLSPFVLAWKAPEQRPVNPSKPSRPGSSVSNTYYDDDDSDTLAPAQLRQQEENDFWDDVQNTIYRARRGDTLRIEAGSYNVPVRVLRTLAERSGLLLVLIDEDGGEITIPSDQVRFPSGNTIKLSYSMNELEKLYANINTNSGVTKLNVTGTAGNQTGTSNGNTTGTAAPNTQNGGHSFGDTNPSTGLGDVIQMTAPQSAFKNPENAVQIVPAPTAPTGAVYEKDTEDSQVTMNEPVQIEEIPVQQKTSRLPAVLAVIAALLCAAGAVWKFGIKDGKFRR